MIPPGRFPHLEIVPSGEGTIVSLIDCPFLNDQTTQTVREELRQFIQESGPGCRVLLNFKQVQRLISTTLSMLLTIHKDLDSMGGQLVLCNIRPEINEVFEVTRLNQVFNIRSEPLLPPGGSDQPDPPPPQTGPNGRGITPQPGNG
jgi:anti-sigma B factor antagonist